MKAFENLYACNSTALYQLQVALGLATELRKVSCRVSPTMSETLADPIYPTTMDKGGCQD